MADAVAGRGRRRRPTGRPTGPAAARRAHRHALDARPGWTRGGPRPAMASQRRLVRLARLVLAVLLVLLGGGLAGPAAAMPLQRRAELREEVRGMFYHAYDNYMRHAFPLDELNPILCAGRGPDRANPDNININDVLGDYAVTLVDNLDTLAVLGNATEFHRAVAAVIAHRPAYELDVQVSVFEATIRVLGGLLAAHLLATDPDPVWAPFHPPGYRGELLQMARDLGERLLRAFQGSATGLPTPRVHLVHGVRPSVIRETCTAGAGTLTLEFGVLSRLTGDPRFEAVAKRATRALWEHRSPLNLVGNVINIDTGRWVTLESGVGAGMDSFFEYLFKAHVLLGDAAYLDMFLQGVAALRRHVRAAGGYLYRNVHMGTGAAFSNWIDSLAAYLPGLLVLAGDVDEAVKVHETYFAIWRRYGGLPERYDFTRHAPAVGLYPLRPELAESTYFLYRATRDPYYLAVGEVMVRDLQARARVPCGYATVRNVADAAVHGNHEDRMESFFLSETLKYLYLLFDEDHPLHRADGTYIFSTEGHLLRAPPRPAERHRRAAPDAAVLAAVADVLPPALLTQTCQAPRLTGAAAWATYGSLGLRAEHHAALRQLVGWSNGIPVPPYQAAALPPAAAAAAATVADSPAGPTWEPSGPDAGATPGEAGTPAAGPGAPIRLFVNVSPQQSVMLDGTHVKMDMVTNSGVRLRLAPLPAHNDDWPELRLRDRSPAYRPSRHPLSDRRGTACPACLDVQDPGAAPGGVQITRVNGLPVDEHAVAEVMQVVAHRPAAVTPLAVVAYAFPAEPSAEALLLAPHVGAVPAWSALFSPSVAGPAGRRVGRGQGFAVVRADDDGCAPWPADALRQRIVVVRRGDCMFVDKVRHAQAAGAAGVVVVNHDDTLLLMGDGGEEKEDDQAAAGPAKARAHPAIRIPAVMVTRHAGAWLQQTQQALAARGQHLFLHFQPASFLQQRSV